jgi:carbamate kinase
MPSAKTAVIAIGGNSLILDKNKPGVEYQWAAVQETAKHIVEMIRAGWRVVITHGNGPQVGFILRRNELASGEVHTTPMDLIGAVICCNRPLTTNCEGWASGAAWSR